VSTTSDNFIPPDRASKLPLDALNAAQEDQNDGFLTPDFMTEDEYSRLLLLFGYGDELATAPNNSRGIINPLDTPMMESIRAKMQNIQ
jgi:hypothetical protein